MLIKEIFEGIKNVIGYMSPDISNNKTDINNITAAGQRILEQKNHGEWSKPIPAEEFLKKLQS